MEKEYNRNERCFVLMKKIETKQNWWRAENLDALIMLEHTCLYFPEDVLLKPLKQDRLLYMDVRLSDLYRMESIFSISGISSGEMNITLNYPSLFHIKDSGVLLFNLCTVWKGLPFVNTVVLRTSLLRKCRGACLNI